MPQLKEDEVLIENPYTWEKYRGNRIHPSILVKLAEIARSQGFKRMIAYINKDNIASLKGAGSVGFKKFKEIPKLKLLFFTRRKHYRGFNADTWLASYPRGDI